MVDEQHATQFRFRWNLLGEAELYLRNTAPFYCAFSQAALRDYSLMKASERSDKLETREDHLCDAFNERVKVTHHHPTAHTSSSSCSLRSDSQLTDRTDDGLVEEQQGVSQTEQDLAALGLPSEFAPREKKKAKKRKRNPVKSVANETWMVGLTFDDYWLLAGDYIIAKTWLKDYGSQMDEATKEQTKLNIVKCKPKRLLPCDRDIQEYTNIVNATCGSEVVATWDEMYNRHCELVKLRAKENFEKLQLHSTLNRCKQFLEKMSELHFTTGFEKDVESGLIEGDVETAEESDCEMKQVNSTDTINEQSTDQQPPAAKKQNARTLVNYGEMELFDDVYADFYNESHASCPLNRPVERDECSTEQDSQSDSAECDDELTMEEKLNFDFGFDAERDRRLIARNCFEVFARDTSIQKYLYQRFRLFSRLNKGVLMDREGWFSVTPERMAQHIADRMVTQPGAVIVDAFTGVGGNAIQFALKGAYVIACDLDPVRLRCALKNARVYGVADRINFVCMDFFHLAMSPRRNAEQQDKFGCVDAVFLSPPWGGPEYLNMKEFDLDTHLTPNGYEVFEAAKGLSPNIAYFLPRQTPVRQLLSLAGPGGSCEVEQNLLNSKVKAITAYYGKLVTGR